MCEAHDIKMEAAGDFPADINMGLTEILLILLGILAFAGSFVIPEKLSNKDSADVKIPEEKIKELIENEVKQASFQIEEKVEETIAAVTEKTERYMERMSNEKIMAIQEFSDTVISQINKNHEEAVFLYDMLNNKHVQVKNTAAEINAKVKSVQADMENNLPKEHAVIVNESAKGIENETGKDNFTSGITGKEVQKVKGSAAKKKVPAKKNVMKKNIDTEKMSDIEIQFEPDSDMGSNKDKILKLHQEGKSNMAIAKSLGLGIGEVKLIIDLFQTEE